MLDKQKRFADAEAQFKQVLAREPENAAALNYLGYMLAERGERLDESVGYIKQALEIEPENGSYLDSLGWAYFKADKLDLAEPNLKRAADQLTTNSVIQDHYGDVLFKRGRYDQAIAAWTRALVGRRRLDRSRRPSTRRSAPPDKSSARNEGAGRRRARLVASAACGAALVKLPSGPGLAGAGCAPSRACSRRSAACRAIRTLTAEVAVSGSAGGHRVRARLSAGVSAPASARLEAVAPFGAAAVHLRRHRQRRHAAAAARQPRARARASRRRARGADRRAARRGRSARHRSPAARRAGGRIGRRPAPSATSGAS